MLNEELRTLTASEPLSLEEEYEMQRTLTPSPFSKMFSMTSEKWQVDEDKLTFIILSRESSLLPTGAGQLTPEDDKLGNLPMVGDVNIFLYGNHQGNSPPLAQSESSEEDETYAEVEIMIAGMFLLLSQIIAIDLTRFSNRRTVIPA